MSNIGGEVAKQILSKPVFCITNGITFSSRRDAAVSLGISESSVYDSIRDNRPHGGYTFVNLGDPVGVYESCIEKPKGNWKDISGYEGIYQISDKGQIWSCPRNVMRRNKRIQPVPGRLLSPNIDTTGYLSVTLSYEGKLRTYLLHRLVALHFIPNPENKPEVNHKDGDKGHNWDTNLEWATRSENERHAISTGLKIPSSLEHMKAMNKARWSK